MPFCDAILRRELSSAPATHSILIASPPVFALRSRLDLCHTSLHPFVVLFVALLLKSLLPHCGLDWTFALAATQVSVAFSPLPHCGLVWICTEVCYSGLAWPSLSLAPLPACWQFWLVIGRIDDVPSVFFTYACVVACYGLPEYLVLRAFSAGKSRLTLTFLSYFVLEP